MKCVAGRKETHMNSGRSKSVENEGRWKAMGERSGSGRGGGHERRKREVCAVVVPKSKRTICSCTSVNDQ
jgi:hypothetical protein